jgi:probable H4MPT-linked C1 transfer pathway protein
MDIIGWDVGGAHLKAARCEAGRVTGAVQIPCPLWSGLERLDTALQQAASRLGSAARHVATMTGELADIFENRHEGTAQISAALRRRLGEVDIYGGRAGWIAAASAGGHAADIASANWHASASLVARYCREALFVDAGSTTTDLIPISGGALVPCGYTDAERLASGALVYTGVVRTPVMAMGRRVPFGGEWTGIAAEHFATAADIYRILGLLPEEADQHPAADNRAKTPAGSRARLARMIGHDAEDADDSAWNALAAFLAEAQLRHVHDAALRLLSATRVPADAPIIAAGTGAFFAARLAARLGRPCRDFASAIGQPAMSEINLYAPAAAVALLASQAR